MPSKYWIKLYQEVLEDPKMGRLPDNLWRRSIELFLLAGELGSDLKEDERGHLPATGEIAWRLRQPEERLEAELHQLAEIGILTQTETGWLVTNFVKRQKHVTDADRMKQYRERKRDKALQERDAKDKDIVTRSVTYRNAEDRIENQEIDKETTREAVKPPAPIRRQKPTEIPAAKIFVEVTGKHVLNSTQMKEIDEVIGRDPPALEKWRCVVKEWQLNGYKLNRINGMLDWFRDGIPQHQPKGQTNGQHSKHTKQPTDHRLAFEREGPPTPEQYQDLIRAATRTGLERP